MAYSGYTALLSRSGRSFVKDHVHKIARTEKTTGDFGDKVQRLYVGDGGYFDDYDFTELKVGDKFKEVDKYSGSRYHMSDYTNVVVVEDDSNSTSASNGGQNMVGQVYSAAVVRTKTVAAGEGVNTGVQVSEVIATKIGFIANSDETARAVALAQAIVEAKGALDASDPTQPVEVRLSKFA